MTTIHIQNRNKDDFERFDYYLVKGQFALVHNLAQRRYGRIIREIHGHYIIEIPKTEPVEGGFGGWAFIFKRTDKTDISKDKATIIDLKKIAGIELIEHLIQETRLYKRDPQFLNKDSIHQNKKPRQNNVAARMNSSIHFAKPNGTNILSSLASSINLTDPGFSQQWHLLNLDKPGFDLNITGVWEQGITGKNVTVAFIDDGVDHSNPDLADNFSFEGSYDFNYHKNLPTPEHWDDTHGTRCAGEVAAVKNDVCGVGIAYNANIAGIRILSGSLTNEDEARSVTFGCNTTSIYSCSWGPKDDGRTVEQPPAIVGAAFEAGINSCRNGLGALYVFAAGNGGTSFDNCNTDGYTNSIYTITVAAMDSKQNHPEYSEKCSAILVTMYSSLGSGMGGIYTTDWKEGCTKKHGGTSAAAPIASGVYALVLSVRPDLNWRDVQRLTVENAIRVNPGDEDWQMNGVKRFFSHKYGYGTFDTYSLIQAAKKFVNVGPQTRIEVKASHLGLKFGLFNFADNAPSDNRTPASGTASHSIHIDLKQLQETGMKKLEHVEVVVDLPHERRGQLSIHLISPSNTTSRLMDVRRLDNSPEGFLGWRMMSVAHWDENPVGEWKLIVTDHVDDSHYGELQGWSLRLWGEMNANETRKAGLLYHMDNLTGELVNGNESASSRINEKAGPSATVFITLFFISLFVGTLWAILISGRRIRVRVKEISSFDIDFDESELDKVAFFEDGTNTSRMRTHNDAETEVLFQRQ